MLRRFLFRSLVLAGILLACLAHLIWNGWHAKQVVAEKPDARLKIQLASNGWGRFLLPAAPLVLLPLLARMDSVHLERVSFRIFVGAVALHTWTALTLLGSRYAAGY